MTFAYKDVILIWALSIIVLVRNMRTDHRSPVHPCLGPQTMGAHFSNGTMLLVVGDVSVDSETSVVTSLFPRFIDPTLFFEGTYRGRYACVYL